MNDLIQNKRQYSINKTPEKNVREFYGKTEHSMIKQKCGDTTTKKTNNKLLIKPTNIFTIVIDEGVKNRQKESDELGRD